MVLWERRSSLEDCNGFGGRGTLQRSFVCLRAIGPTHGMSQRTPLNAFTIAMMSTIKKPIFTNTEHRLQRPDSRPPIAGTWLRIKLSIDDTKQNKNQAAPKMIDCIA